MHVLLVCKCIASRQDRKLRSDARAKQGTPGIQGRPDRQKSRFFDCSKRPEQDLAQARKVCYEGTLYRTSDAQVRRRNAGHRSADGRTR